MKLVGKAVIRLILLYVTLGAWQSAGPVFAQGDSLQETLEPRGYVNDFAGLMQDRSAALEQMLAQLDQKAGAQIAVVTLTSLEGGEIRDFANRLFERWGIGHQDDRGLLLLLALEEKQIWVEVGYGLEPLLPDSRVGRVLDQYAVPFFREGNYADGLVSGTAAFAEIIAQDAGVVLEGTSGVGPVAPSPAEGRPLTCGETVFFLLMAVAAIYLFIRHPWLFILLLSSGGGRGGSGGFGGGFGGGGFGGFGGGASGGGGAGRSW